MKLSGRTTCSHHLGTLDSFSLLIIDIMTGNNVTMNQSILFLGSGYRGPIAHGNCSSFPANYYYVVCRFCLEYGCIQSAGGTDGILSHRLNPMKMQKEDKNPIRIM